MAASVNSFPVLQPDVAVVGYASALASAAQASAVASAVRGTAKQASAVASAVQETHIAIQYYDPKY